jgi:hypothetical protein
MYLGYRCTVDLGDVIAARLDLGIEQLLNGHGSHRIRRMVLPAAWTLLAAIAGDEAAPTSAARRTVRGIRGFVAVVAWTCVNTLTQIEMYLCILMLQYCCCCCRGVRRHCVCLEQRSKRVGRACLIAGHVRAAPAHPCRLWPVPKISPSLHLGSTPLVARSQSRHARRVRVLFHPTDMAPRASSPALSENEFDIFDALAGGDGAEQQMRATADLGLDLGIGSDDGSDDEAFIAAKQAAANRKNANAPGKPGKKGGGFQAMGLNAALLKAIAQKGFKIPTPIQRKAVPLMLQGDDVVGMARTGSGKTAAFVIPMIQKLKTHSAKVGARGVIMSPSRELALQTLKVVKELGRGTDLRTILLVGGDSLEERAYSTVYAIFLVS